jgi:putative oxidoreductase
MNTTEIINQEPLLSIILLVARLAVALVFLVSGIDKSLNYSAAVEEFRREKVAMAGLVLPVTIALHLIASIAIIAGVFVSESALLLAVFLFGATVQVHCFWKMSGEDFVIHSRIALVNLAAFGGLLLLAVMGPGRFVLFG